MAEEFYSGIVYRLRASAPMPVAEGTYAGGFVLHTFGAEVNDVDIYECTQDLPASTEFIGQGGDLWNASFSRLGDREGHFQGRITHPPDYIEEDDLNFNYDGNQLDASPDPSGAGVEFIECTSLSISYDVLGLATISYTIVSDVPVTNLQPYNEITAGGKTFRGYITNLTSNSIQGTAWYETHVTLISTTTV